jgi:LysR family nitrogen assimilation transcriptional regulator
MDIRRLQCFQAVVEEKVLTRAAERLRLAPSALSRQVVLLEHEIGRPLFSREGKRLIPTAEGMFLYQRSSVVLRDVALLRQDVAAFASEPSGKVRLGTPPSLRDLIAIPVLDAVLRRYPKVTVVLEEGMAMSLRDKLADGSVDLAVLPTVEPMADMHLLPLACESTVIVGPIASALSMKRSVTLNQLLDHPLICSPPMNSLRKILDLAAHKAKRVPDIRVETNLAETLIALVEIGQGFGFLPASGVQRSVREKRVCAAPVKGLSMEWVLARRKNLASSPVVRALEEILVTQVASLLANGGWPTATRSRAHLSSVAGKT